MNDQRIKKEEGEGGGKKEKRETESAVLALQKFSRLLAVSV